MTRPLSPRRRDPYAVGMATLSTIVLVGFVMIGLGWRVVARSNYVDLQTPALASGCLAGTALVVVGASLMVGLHARRQRVLTRARLGAALDVAEDVYEVLARRGGNA